MSKRLIIFAGLLPFVLVTGINGCEEKQLSKPNIVVIYTDDQGYGDVSALNPNSKFQTPNIDRLANQGLIFTDGHSGDTVCTPSRYGLLTGRYSWRTELKKGVLGADGGGLIEEDRMTLASLLGDNGYTTGMVGKWHLGMQFVGQKGENRDWSKPVRGGPVDRGFDYFYGIPASMNYGVLTYIENDSITEPPVLWTAKKKNHHAIQDYRIKPPYEKNSDLKKFDYINQRTLEVAPSFKDTEVLSITTDKAVNWIEEVSKGPQQQPPFFLYVSYTSPHKPVAPIERFRGKSDVGWYGDFMMETDHHVGQILDELDQQGISDNTIVIFSSDNGAETTYQKRKSLHKHASNWKLKGGKRDIYEGGHRVPFIVRWPAVIEPGRICEHAVSQLDLFRTFADLLDVKLPDDAGEDSYSLLPIFKSDDHKNYRHGPLIHHSVRGDFAIRDGKWKLNMFRGSGGSLKPTYYEPKEGEPPFELYNMEEDWRETTNLYKQYPEVVDSLTTKITNIIKKGRSTPGKPQANKGGDDWPQKEWMD